MAPRGCHKMGPGEARAGMALAFLNPNLCGYASAARCRGTRPRGEPPARPPLPRGSRRCLDVATGVAAGRRLRGQSCSVLGTVHLSRLRRQQRAASLQPQASLLSSGRGAAIAEMVSDKKTRALFFFFFRSASACGGGEACFRLRSAMPHRKQHAPFPSPAKQQPCAKSRFPCELLPHGGPQPAAPRCGIEGQSQIEQQQGWWLLLAAISGVKPP